MSVKTALQHNTMLARIRSISTPLAVTIRPSRRSFTGFVACVFYPSQAQATTVSRIVSVIAGRPCYIRPVQRRSSPTAFYVSVPVQV